MSNNKKFLFVFDLDDTLLNKKKNISLRDKFFIKKLLKQGHEVILASGRPVRAMMVYYNQLGLRTPLIGHNGTLVYHPLDKNFPNSFFPFKIEDIEFILKKIEESGKEMYANAICETLNHTYMIKAKEYEDKFLHFKSGEVTAGPLKNILTGDPQSFLIDMNREDYDIELIRSIVESRPNMKARFWGRPLKTFVEVYYTNLTKGTALEYLFEKMPHLKEYTLVCFGDGDNDYPMLDMAGKYGFIMKNSHHLDEVNYNVSLDTCEKSGVSKTIKYILKRDSK